MLLRHNQRPIQDIKTNGTAFVVCPAGLNGGVLQTASAPHPMYAYAFEQARRAVAIADFRRLHTPSMN